MNKTKLTTDKNTFYFYDPQFCRLPWDTVSQLWPILEKAPFRKNKKGTTSLMQLPELIQLELALILIRRDYVSFRLAEERPDFAITLEVHNATGNCMDK